MFPLTSSCLLPLFAVFQSVQWFIYSKQVYVNFQDWIPQYLTQLILDILFLWASHLYLLFDCSKQIIQETFSFIYFCFWLIGIQLYYRSSENIFTILIIYFS